jgi:transcriptional regulator of aromatic amino acid metabolism
MMDQMEMDRLLRAVKSALRSNIALTVEKVSMDTMLFETRYPYDGQHSFTSKIEPVWLGREKRDSLLGGPLLGLATTRQLLEEVAVRMERDNRAMDWVAGHSVMQKLGIECRQALAKLPRPVLEYRTVDS